MRVIEARFQHGTAIELLPPKYRTDDFLISSGISTEVMRQDQEEYEVIDPHHNAILTEEEFFDLYQFCSIVRVIEKKDPPRPPRKVELSFDGIIGWLQTMAPPQKEFVEAIENISFPAERPKFEKVTWLGEVLGSAGHLSKVDAIKYYRTLTGFPLMDSKKAIEQGFVLAREDEKELKVIADKFRSFGMMVDLT